MDSIIVIVSILLTGAGLCVGLYTLIRVQRVAKAQQQERRITQELLDVDQIENEIKRVISKLSELNDTDSLNLAKDLSRRLGAIQGARRVMDPSVTEVPLANAVTLEYGFFSSNFVNELINESTSRIEIMTGSTRLISGFYTMDKVRQACERGVRVRIIGIDPEAPDDILRDAVWTVSSPAPTTATEYRELIIENHKTIKDNVNKWKSDFARARFAYRAHPGVPRVSIARSDDWISLGFLQLFRNAQPAEIKDRQFIRVSQGSSLGQVMSKHFEMGWKEARPIIPEKKETTSMPVSNGTEEG